MPQELLTLVGALILLSALLFAVLEARTAKRRMSEQQRQMQAYADQQEESARFKSRVSELGIGLLQAETSEQTANLFLTHAHRMLDLVQGLVYLTIDGSTLRLAGSFGCAGTPPAELGFGDGVVGQCAVDRQRKVLKMPDDPLTEIRSGLGATRPACVILCPILLNDLLIGVLEMAFLHAPAEDALAKIDEMTHVLAVGLQIRGRP